MSYHEGSNWQAKKEDEGKPLYSNEKNIPINTELDEFKEWWKHYPATLTATIVFDHFERYYKQKWLNNSK